MNTIIKEILEAEWERRRQESVRRGEVEGGEDESGSGGDGRGKVG